MFSDHNYILLNTIKQAPGSSATPYKLAPDYFNEFTARLLQKIIECEFDDTEFPLLKKAPRQMPYSVPGNYFNTSTRPLKPTTSFLNKKILAVAAVFLVVLTMSVIWIQLKHLGNNKEKYISANVDQHIQYLSSAQLLKFLNTEEGATEVVQIVDPKTDNTLNALFNNIPSAELENFLLETSDVTDESFN